MFLADCPIRMAKKAKGIQAVLHAETTDSSHDKEGPDCRSFRLRGILPSENAALDNGFPSS
jgi:hypothetical protein